MEQLRPKIIVPVANLIRLANSSESGEASVHDRAVQTDLVRADRIVPITSFAGNRESGCVYRKPYPH